MAHKRRLLDLLVDTYPALSRDQLYRRIMCAEVTVNGDVVHDPAFPVESTARLALRDPGYVSRGGEKLAAALSAWDITVVNKIWLDAGASTGGFTDALLKAGARAVHAVDVGYNQLDYRLRRDARVMVYERTNIKDVMSLDPQPHAAVCDLSFRSLRGILHHILGLTAEGWGIALLKPQFEAAAEVRWGRRLNVDLKSGVVDPQIRDELVAGAIRELSEQGVEVRRSMDSPVAGRSGNREVLLHVYLRKSAGRNGSPI